MLFRLLRTDNQSLSDIQGKPLTQNKVKEKLLLERNFFKKGTFKKKTRGIEVKKYNSRNGEKKVKLRKFQKVE